jgi:hypothetical protein
VPTPPSHPRRRIQTYLRSDLLAREVTRAAIIEAALIQAQGETPEATEVQNA